MSNCPDAHQTKASSVQTFLYVEKLRTAPACIHPDDSAARSDDPQCSIKPQDFFPKPRYGKIAATVRTTWILVWMRSSIRQVSQFKSRCPDASQHGPDARASDMEIACIRSAIRMTIIPARTLGNYVQQTYDRLGDRASPSGRSSQTGKIFSEIFGISVAKLSVRTAYDLRPDGAQFYQARRSFELSAYK
jgi:hypothetical protein